VNLCAPAIFTRTLSPKGDFTMNTSKQRLAGLGLILLAIGFNASFAALAHSFDYPDILRRPPPEVLTRFAQGGAALIAMWAAFTLCAAMFVPLSGLVRSAMRERGYAGGDVAFACGAAAGIAQAVGLSRWVFAVPGLAAASQTPGQSDLYAAIFMALHQFAGVGIGEHLGQVFTALWTLALCGAQAKGGLPGRVLSIFALASAALILGGLVEGFATVLAFDPGVLALATPVGFMLLSLWMIATGLIMFVWPKTREQ
jgi:hypothetical protein